VVLTGGCFQNARLTESAVAALRAAGHEPIWHRRVPPNDGGIALGQAAWAAWLMSGRIASHEDLGETA
jgi:hydrogenase maturation protein HypF